MGRDPDDTEGHEVTYIGTTLGWGGIAIGSDGVGYPVPEHEALIAAIPQWVNLPEHLDDATRIYVEVLQRPEAAVRLAAVRAIGAVVRRYGRLPRPVEARVAVAHATNDTDLDVRNEAAATLSEIERLIS